MIEVPITCGMCGRSGVLEMEPEEAKNRDADAEFMCDDCIAEDKAFMKKDHPETLDAQASDAEIREVWGEENET